VAGRACELRAEVRPCFALGELRDTHAVDHQPMDGDEVQRDAPATSSGWGAVEGGEVGSDGGAMRCSETHTVSCTAGWPASHSPSSSDGTCIAHTAPRHQWAAGSGQCGEWAVGSGEWAVGKGVGEGGHCVSAARHEMSQVVLAKGGLYLQQELLRNRTEQRSQSVAESVRCAEARAWRRELSAVRCAMIMR
jgi:hypothetical protein